MGKHMVCYEQNMIPSSGLEPLAPLRYTMNVLGAFYVLGGGGD